jgi:hypothetical protein
VIRTLASTENPLFSQASMLAAAAASSRQERTRMREGAHHWRLKFACPDGILERVSVAWMKVIP